MGDYYEVPGGMRVRTGLVPIEAKVRDGSVPTELYVELRSVGTGPAVSLKVEVRQGIPVCTEVWLRAHPEGPEIRPTDLKTIHVDSLVEQAVALCTRHPESDGSLSVAAPTPADRQNAQRARKARPGRGRPSVASQRLHQVADLYTRHGDGGRPVQVICEVLGVSPRTAARYVQQCRADGLLPQRERA